MITFEQDLAILWILQTQNCSATLSKPRTEEQLSVLRHEMREMSERQGNLLSAFSSQISFLVDQMQKLQALPAPCDTGPGSSPAAAPEPSSPVAPTTTFICPNQRRSSIPLVTPATAESSLCPVSYILEFQVSSFPTEHSKIISHLSGGLKLGLQLNGTGNRQLKVGCKSRQLSPSYSKSSHLVQRLPGPLSLFVRVKGMLLITPLSSAP